MTTTDPTTGRRRRANGEASREKILDAAAEIAGERGYDGTSIGLISERSGLPASSIYWHFGNKDELIAAVIDRSFNNWIANLRQRGELPAGVPPVEALRVAMQHTGTALAQAPDFLRLGLMLILDRRPDEPSARTKFLEVRRITHANTVRLYTTLFPELSDPARQRLATFTVAAADGILVAHEIEHIDMTEAFELLASAVLGAVDHLARA